MNENFKELVKQEAESVLRKAARETVFPAMKEVNDIMMKIFKAGLDAGVEATIRVLAKKN